MKKRWIAAVLVCALALTGGCGKSKSTDTENTTGTGIAGQYPDSKVTKLGNYKGVEIPKEDVEVNDDEPSYTRNRSSRSRSSVSSTSNSRNKKSE